MSRAEKLKHSRSTPPAARQRCEPAQGPSQVLLVAGLAVAVCLVVAAVHWPALSARALTFDDDQYLTENKLVQHPSWANAQTFLKEVLSPSTVDGYYQPLTMISLMLDTAAGGRPDHLLPYHRTSLMLHAANAGLVTLILFLLFGRPWPAAIVGLLWGIHPITVETIPWIGERKTLLASFFALWSIVLYLRYARRGPRWLYAAVVLAYVLALMAKPTTTPLPAAMLLLDIWPLRRPLRRALLEKLPLFAIAGVFSWIAMWSQAATCGLQVINAHRTIGSVSLVLAHNSVFYLYKLLWPAYLSSHYPFPNPMVWTQPMVLAGLLITPVLVAVMISTRRRAPALLVGWTMFIGILFPAMGAFGFNNVIASDKYAYLPLLGICIAAAWALGQAWPRRKQIMTKAARNGPPWLSGRLPAICGLVLLIAAAEAYATRTYVGKWQDTETLYKHMLVGAPKAPSLHSDLALKLSEEGKTDEALEHFRLALQYGDGFPGTLCIAHNNIGIAYARANKLDDAVSHFEQAVSYHDLLLRSDPHKVSELASAHFNLANAFSLQGNMDAALEQYRQVVNLTPADAEAHLQLGKLLAIKGEMKEALTHLQNAVQLDPTNELAKTTLAEFTRTAPR